MSEIFALPKVVKQLSELKWSWFKKWWIDLMKILFLWDKNRTLLSWVKRAATIWGFAFFDHFWWDSNDNEWTDALCYMYWWIITTAIWTALFDDA
jgi:hypothetical protein